MRAGVWAATVAAFLVGCGTVWAACPSRQSGNCVNLDLVPQISQQIVADEHLPAPPKRAPEAEPETPYTGPTVGLNKKVRQAPQVGYRWAIN